MEMVTSDSEERLADLLPEVEKEAAGWIGAHINLTPLHEQLLGSEGLSEASLDKVVQVSHQMAGHLMEWGLRRCEGTLLVFGDSDLLCLLRKSPPVTDEVMQRLQEEFRKSGLGHLLHFYDMEDRLADIVALSTAKRSTAAIYREKHRAVELADQLMKRDHPDADATRLIQKKRQQRGKSCVLIIEDDILTRGMLKTVLKQEHQVIQAGDARNGLVQYIDAAPDVVFLDIHLPDMSGNDLLRRLRTLDPSAYIVMLSGDSVKDNITNARRHGAAGFICKPFTKEKVIQYVQQCPLLAVNPAMRSLGWRKVESQP